MPNESDEPPSTSLDALDIMMNNGLGGVAPQMLILKHLWHDRAAWCHWKCTCCTYLNYIVVIDWYKMVRAWREKKTKTKVNHLTSRHKARRETQKQNWSVKKKNIFFPFYLDHEIIMTLFLFFVVSWTY